ncbi:MAG: SRPBCC family protein [Acidimicrobiia bacterium]
MLRSGKVLGGEPGRAVVRFSGRAGPFRYRTVEEVRFSDRCVTFRHLQGPFHRCEEVMHVEPDALGATTIAHEGELTMRGGLAGWIVGVAAVRPAFERHVGDHLRQLTAADQSR